MADQSIIFELVSPEALVLSEPVAMVVVPGFEGDMGVLPGHAPTISILRPGVISVYGDQQTTISQKLFVAGGAVEITAERCTVLAEEAEPVDQMVAQDIEQNLKNLREDLEDARDDQAKESIKKHISVNEAKLRIIQG